MASVYTAMPSADPDLADRFAFAMVIAFRIGWVTFRKVIGEEEVIKPTDRGARGGSLSIGKEIAEQEFSCPFVLLNWNWKVGSAEVAY